jgi:DNA-binding NtrC family response regulator
MKNSRESKRVLIVEDEPIIGRICAETLTGEGFGVDIATNGSIAEDMIEENKYSLLLNEIRTPVMNGKHLYQWITERHPELAKRVIFTTGELLLGSATEEFIEQSGKPFLPKPFAPDALRTVVREAIHQIGK